MKRRGFLAGLFALPAAAKAMVEIKPDPVKVYEEALGEKFDYSKMDEWVSFEYSCSIGPSSPTANIITTDRMK